MHAEAATPQPAPRVSGQPRLPPAEEILAIMERDGITKSQLARRYNTSPQAVSVALRRAANAGRVPKLQGRTLPWKVRTEHARGDLYQAILAQAKIQKHQDVKGFEVSAASKVQSAAQKLGRYLTYNPDRGFYWRRLRPDEVPEGIFAPAG